MQIRVCFSCHILRGLPILLEDVGHDFVVLGPLQLDLPPEEHSH